MPSRYLLTMLLLATGLAAVGCSVSPEDQARTTIQQVGGKIGADAHGQIVSIDLSDTPANDEVLALVRYFPTVKSINCTNAGRVTGTGMAQLGGLHNLETLFLVNTGLDDRGLVNVRHLTSLKTLHLGRTHITDFGLRALGPLANLQTLSLGNTAVTDQGLVQLRNLRKLSTIILRDTKTTPAGIQELHRMLPEARVID